MVKKVKIWSEYDQSMVLLLSKIWTRILQIVQDSQKWSKLDGNLQKISEKLQNCVHMVYLRPLLVASLQLFCASFIDQAFMYQNTE